MQECKRNYTSNDLIRIAKRDNNKKRPYLIVNPCQGKHIPVSPGVAMEIFKTLGQQVDTTIKDDETVLVIAFAETATAIGAGIASEITKKVYYIQTTRETIEGADYLYFSEAHSHATEQRLVKNQLEETLRKVDKIIFAEDEVTTGNTICNLIRELEALMGGRTYHYVIASVLNGMTKEIEQQFSEKKIQLEYLLKTSNQEYEQVVEQFEYDGLMLRASEENSFGTFGTIEAIPISNYKNPRLLITMEEYKKSCEQFASRAASQIGDCKAEDLLVLGTEEFMYPALCVAKRLEETSDAIHVNFHATTRSPILTSNHKGYPLSRRIELKSLYDEERTTYIYNLRKYDKVVIITDATQKSQVGLATLLHALETAGNSNVTLLEWRD